jgi:hypothetical protein
VVEAQYQGLGKRLIFWGFAPMILFIGMVFGLMILGVVFHQEFSQDSFVDPVPPSDLAQAVVAGYVVLMMVMLVLTVMGQFLLWIACGVYAADKGYNPVLWMVIYLFITWISFIILAFQPNIKDRSNTPPPVTP